MEQLTYFSYRNGYDPALLPLGSLALDYSNPRLHKPFVNKPSTDAQTSDSDSASLTTTRGPQIENWVHHDPRTNCLLRTQTKRSFDGDIGLKDLLSFNHGRNGMEDIIVVGAEGSKIEIEEPDVYFKEVTLKSDRARFWLESRLTVSNEFISAASKLTRSPQIWLLTGQYIIKDSKSFNVTSTERKSGGKAQIPIIEPSGIAALLGLRVGASLNFANGSEFTAGADYPGDRIWAAQWQRVDAQYMTVKKWNAKEKGSRLKLLDVLSPGNQRAQDGDKDIVEVKLSERDAAVGDNGDFIDLPQDYWAGFDKELKYLVDDYPEFEDLLVEN